MNFLELLHSENPESDILNCKSLAVLILILIRMGVLVDFAICLRLRLSTTPLFIHSCAPVSPVSPSTTTMQRRDNCTTYGLWYLQLHHHIAFP